ncbi:MAG: phosphoenolpyruvate synthase [Patescibacteria group bacterium]
MVNKKKQFVIWFKDLTIKDVPLVGGKNAALGEMYACLTPLGINIPNGFALTAYAYRYFLKSTGLDAQIKKILKGLNTKNIKNLQARGKAVRRAIVEAKLPKELEREIAKAYKKLEKMYGADVDTAVRSSATAEDLPGASFAGQQETYLNIRGVSAVLEATKKCIASLFTDRAISYRKDKGFSHFDAALSVGVQKMVRSDAASSGVAFTIDTESGFDKIIVINGSWGLGEMIVQGKVIPDEWIIFKPTLAEGKKAIIAQNLGEKKVKLIYAPTGTKKVSISENDKNRFCLKEDEVITLAKWCVKIEEHFKHPMDIEWAKDGKTKELFIVQARPETVHAMESKKVYKEYHLLKRSKILTSGIAVGAKIGAGAVRVIESAKKIGEFKKGEVLVTRITDPDWEPIMKIASAIVTDEGGRTSHAAIVSRELSIPCIVGTKNSTVKLKNRQIVTVDCSSGETGVVYDGKLPFEAIEHDLGKIPKPPVKIMVNIGTPDEAFKNHYLPVEGVGLGRLEFIIASHIKIHPNALLNYGKLKDKQLKEKIDKLTLGYKNKVQYYIDELAEGIAKIGAAFHPYEVIIRFSDFKTNEYSKLLGGAAYEPHEENPMIGWRGASRYYDPKFEAAFGLEVKAMKKVRETMGLTNVIPMIPFCRTPEEGEQVVKTMAKYGLSRKKDKSLKIYVMCEIPSNILLADKFLEVFDGMSIGSNDLTQLTLGLDRDSGIVTHIANEKNESVKKLIAEIIAKCNKKKKYIGICGQAPSDYPDFAEFLVKAGIHSMSLNPDTVIKTIVALSKK